MRKVRSDDFEFKPGEILANRYRVVRGRGRGGMGDVYEVVDLFLEKPFALKTIRETDADGSPRPWQALAPRFQLEAKISAYLRDPTSIHEGKDRILTLLYYALLTDGRPFAVMDLLSGLTLSSYLSEHKRARFTTACLIGRDTCLGLAYSHERDVIHRDIKGDNVFLEPGPNLRALVADFGVAKILTEAPEKALTGGGYQPVGTPGFIPREAYRGVPPSSATDMFAVGIIIFQMITGRTPWAHLGDDGLRLILSDRPPKAPLLTDFLENYGDEEYNLASMVARCLQHSPEHRPDAATMAVACERAEMAIRKRDAGHSAVEVNATIEDESLLATTMIEKAAKEQSGAPAGPWLPSIITDQTSGAPSRGRNFASLPTQLSSQRNPAPLADPAKFPVVIRDTQRPEGPTLPSGRAPASSPAAMQASAARETPAAVSRTVDPGSENSRRRDDRVPTPDPAVYRALEAAQSPVENLWQQEQQKWNEKDASKVAQQQNSVCAVRETPGLEKAAGALLRREDRVRSIALRVIAATCGVLLLVIAGTLVKRFGSTAPASANHAASLNASASPVARFSEPAHSGSAAPPSSSAPETRVEAAVIDASAPPPRQEFVQTERPTAKAGPSVTVETPAPRPAAKPARAKRQPTSVQEMGL